MKLRDGTEQAAGPFLPVSALLEATHVEWSVPTTRRLVSYLAAAFLAYLIWEQLRYHVKRLRTGGKALPGPLYVVPLLGCVPAMVADPFRFWDRQRAAALSGGGLSANTLLGKFMVYVSDPEASRHVLAHNDPGTLLMAVHPSGKAILGGANLAFMHGPKHKAIRRSFLALFTRKALGTYVRMQDAVIRRHLTGFLAVSGGRFIDLRPLIRDMNAATSQEVFAGPYVRDAERNAFLAAFKDMTQGFLALPVCMPGTAVWRAREGRRHILRVLTRGAAESKAAMQTGSEPRCLMDFWAQRCLEEAAMAAEDGLPPPAHAADGAMADTVMDFLFASQDASTASLVWLTALLADRPDVLDKVLEEQLRVRRDLTATIGGEELAAMPYARQVVMEVLRYRPPAPMVPQVAQKDFPLKGGYVAPAGSLIMPSITAASMQGFTDVAIFDPERFSPERNEGQRFQRNYLTFGHGPHACVGREYAINHLTLYLALLATTCEWQRRRTAASVDDAKNWQYLPTVHPADCFISLIPRAA